MLAHLRLQRHGLVVAALAHRAGERDARLRVEVREREDRTRRPFAERLEDETRAAGEERERGARGADGGGVLAVAPGDFVESLSPARPSPMRRSSSAGSSSRCVCDGIV